VILLVIVALAFVRLLAAQTSNNALPPATASQQAAQSVQNNSTHKLHLPPNFSAEHAYKQNCTRCHSEVPKLNGRVTKTLLRHMRVWANIPQDEGGPFWTV
jgi:hypothetical protein